jgi:hypothetical protein
MTSAAASNVTDITAEKCKRALSRIEAGEQARAQSAAKTREDWREYGAGLLEQRERMPSNNAFGEWVKSNGLDAGCASAHGVRADAMWLARNWSVVHACTTTQHHPTHLRQECRNAGHAWAFDERTPRARTGRIGWTLAVERHIPNGLPNGYSRNTLAQSRTTRDRVEAELRAQTHNPTLTIPRSITPDDPMVAQIAAAVLACHARTRPAEAGAAVAAEVATLPETAQQKLERLVEAKARIVTAELNAQFQQRVDAQVVESRAAYHQMVEEQKAERDTYRRLIGGLPKLMTQEEYRLIVGCLHSDRQTEAERAKYDKAFAIMRRAGDAARW